MIRKDVGWHVHRHGDEPRVAPGHPAARRVPARANLSKWPPPKVDLLRRLLRDEPLAHHHSEGARAVGAEHRQRHRGRPGASARPR